MQKRILWIFVLALFLAACGGSDDYMPEENEAVAAFVADAVIREPQRPVRDDAPISRGQVARMIALTFADQTAINQALRVIDFADVNVNDIFERYINKSYILGHLRGDGSGNFYPSRPLTLEQAQWVLDGLNPDSGIRIQMTEENREMAVSYALWMNLYVQLLESMDTQVARRDAVVLITSEFNRTLPAGNIVTNIGRFLVTGLDFADYLDVELELLIRGTAVLGIIGINTTTPTMENVFILSQNPESITIFAGGAGRTYKLADTARLDSGRIADITISGHTITHIRQFGEVKTGVVTEVSAGHIEIEGIGKIYTHEGFTIYSYIGGNIAVGRLSQIIIGYDVADFVLRDDGQMASAIILRRPIPDYIRVLISTTGFVSRTHPSVEMRSAGGLLVHAPDGIIEIAPNEVFRLNAQNYHILGGQRVTIEPVGPELIELMSITRNWGAGIHPQYRGTFEVSGRGGRFIVVNRLLLEEYLYAVIPSEMPTAFGLTAAKVQAVTARSYAYNQFFANRFHAYGANIDDSVMTQVYNNIPETALARQAVYETRGLLLTYNGNVVSANYFSTSSGHTADRGDVWINFATGRLDAYTPSYLAGQPQHFGEPIDLSNEEHARAFFMDTSIEAYDDNSPWFRWNFTVTPAQLGRIINNNLPRLNNARPNMFYPRGVTNIGDFRSIEVVNRGRGGNVNEILIRGTSAYVTVLTEFTIRELLTPSLPEGILLNRHNASGVNNHFILPSTFMTFATTEAGNIQFHGGGFGHGVGMSQHGAYGMVRRGYDFRQILAHFYPGTRVERQN
ncbi:MAG: SpoIID/LytB domain-containing protein [Defluviitaleaceae bacterium]|nr:SpoIID/LytB domain-containing protein [Defluviitaleaceae bacterium]